MITRCPACSTSFHVSAGQLAAASGMVRCGSCLHIFHAPDHAQEADEAAPTLAGAVEVVSESAPAPAPAAAEPPAIRPGLAEIEPEPVVLQARVASPWPRRLAWTFLNLLLAGVLSLQYIYWNFEDLRATRSLGPVLTHWCNQFRCPPPSRIALDHLGARKLVVRAHPERDDALRVDFLLVNSAAFRQRLPDIELRFSRLDGSLSARGRFRPAEYAGSSSQQLLQPSEARRIYMEISDPGEESVNYVLNLLAPEAG